MTDSIKSVNFLSCVNFIENSRNARDYIEYIPFKAEKDLVDLRVIFTDKYTKDTIYNSSLPFYTSRNFSFDFSSGFFLSFIHEDLYYLEKRDSLTNNVLPENNSASDISIGALGHLSWKFTSWFKAGISIGAALSPFDAKTRYLIGSSAIFGREKQLGINLGCALARMDLLSQKVREDTAGKYLPADIKDIPTYKKIQPGLYVGITYNLISGKK